MKKPNAISKATIDRLSLYFRTLRLLQDELEATMALCGVDRLDRISTDYFKDPSFRRTDA